MAVNEKSIMTQFGPPICAGLPLQRPKIYLWHCRTCCSTPSASFTSFSSSSSSSSSCNVEDDVSFDGIVQDGRMRLDFWLASHLPSHISRARVQSSIRLGLALVNGQPVDKVSYSVRNGDHVKCRIAALAPLKAEPEDIGLDIVFEDEHVLVVNKPAHMVTHPAPGNWSGTLVNALVHHCELPVACEAIGETFVDEIEEDDSDNEDERLDPSENLIPNIHRGVLTVRPGIVHRLDKGTSGLLVIAKDEHAHEHLSKQFKDRTVKRSYLSLMCGTPTSRRGRVDASIGRDCRNRIRMAVVPNSSTNKKARNAVSGYEVVEVLANGGASLVEWKLETGRTHQIRVHAQHLGHPLLGDDVYGGTKGAALSCILPKLHSSTHGVARKLINQMQRPSLHAATLGFIHPRSLEKLTFTCPLPQDFDELWLQLKSMNNSRL